MDKHEGLLQVLTLSAPPVENFADPRQSVELSRLANDEMAELVAKYPDRFAAAVACLPMNDMKAALDERIEPSKTSILRGSRYSLLPRTSPWTRRSFSRSMKR